MTNEQIAGFIQQGGADDLVPVLWERVKHLMYKLCGQYFGRYSERFAACGVELSDLRQECYPAFLKAVDSFKPDEKTCFTSYLNYPIKNAAAQLLGIRNKDKQNKQPLDNCASLDKEIESESGTFTLGEVVSDPTAQQAFENAVDRISDEQTRQVLSVALDKLEKPLRDVIVLYYFEGMTLEAVSEKEGVSIERIRQRKRKALEALRRNPAVRMLREEQRIEERLHYSSSYYGEAYYIAQRQIKAILALGDYLSYGKRQAILYDCMLEEAQEKSPEYRAMSELERILAERKNAARSVSVALRA